MILTINIDSASKEIAVRLRAEMKQRHIGRVDMDTVRAAVAGYCCNKVMKGHELEDLENATLRKFVEACA